jgi:hypothetical protein
VLLKVACPQELACLPACLNQRFPKWKGLNLLSRIKNQREWLVISLLYKGRLAQDPAQKALNQGEVSGSISKG